MRPTIIAACVLLLASLGLAAGCSTQTENAGAIQGTAIGIDVESMNKAVAPGDDFYLYANGNWLDTAIVADDAAAARRRDAAAELTRTRLLAIVQELAGTPRQPGSDEALVRRFYLSFLNRNAIEQAGRAPIQTDLDRIAAIADRAALAREMGAQVRADGDPWQIAQRGPESLFGIPVLPSPDDGRNVPWLVPGGLGLPVTAYDDAALVTGYRDYVARVLEWAGVADPRGQAGRIVALEKRLAAARDAGMVQSWSRSDLEANAPGIDWAGFLGGAGLGAQQRFATNDPAAIAAASAIAGSADMATMKAWLAFHMVNRVADLLPARVADAQFQLYGGRIAGQKVQAALKTRAVERIGELYGDVLGRYYADRYLDKAEQQDVLLIANTVREAFVRRIEGSEGIDPAVRDAAVAKLEALRVDVGAPAKPERIARPRPKGTGAIDLERASGLGIYRAGLARIGQPADPGQWTGRPYDFGGFYAPLRNAVEIGAAMLQPPFYASGSDAAANYGAIGSVVGRLMAQALASPGSAFDADGRPSAALLDAGEAQLAQIATQLSGQYGEKADGAAKADTAVDLTGLSLAYDAYRASLGRKEPPVIEGFTGDQRFFIAYAQMAAIRYRDPRREAAMALTASDRVSVVRNVAAWYRAFDVQPQAKLYIPPDDRARAW